MGGKKEEGGVREDTLEEGLINSFLSFSLHHLRRLCTVAVTLFTLTAELLVSPHPGLGPCCPLNSSSVVM